MKIILILSLVVASFTLNLRDGEMERAACKCGVERTSTTSRIVGGTEVNPKNKYPWIVSLVGADSTFPTCGGTLVASKYVVTAAHCMSTDAFANNAPSSPTFKVRIGEHDWSTTSEGKLKEITLDVKKYTVHESYSSEPTLNDIAVIELAKEVDLTIYTPACMAKTSDGTFAGKNALLYGWGKTVNNGESSKKLLEVQLPVVTNTVCEVTYGPAAYGGSINEGSICAGGVKDKSGCQGDSGGPLTYKSGTQHVLIGSVSFGAYCGNAANLYGVFARTSYYRTWIISKMTSPKYCGTSPDAAA